MNSRIGGRKTKTKMFSHPVKWQYMLFMLVLSLGPSGKVHAGDSNAKESYVGFVELVEPALKDFLNDDFCTGSKANNLWTAESGDWEMEDCAYKCSNGMDATAWIGKRNPRSILWGDYRIESRIFLEPSCTGDAGVIFRAFEADTDSGKYYYLGIGANEITAEITDADEKEEIQSVSTASGLAQWLIVNIDVVGGQVDVKVTLESGDTYQFVVYDSTFGSGSVGLKAKDCPVKFDYLTVVGPEGYDVTNNSDPSKNNDAVEAVASFVVLESNSNNNLRLNSQVKSSEPLKEEPATENQIYASKEDLLPSLFESNENKAVPAPIVDDNNKIVSYWSMGAMIMLAFFVTQRFSLQRSRYPPLYV